jgi:hypothetical protein
MSATTFLAAQLQEHNVGEVSLNEMGGTANIGMRLGRKRVMVTGVREIAGRGYTPGRITEALMKEYAALVVQSPKAVAKVVAGQRRAGGWALGRFRGASRRWLGKPVIARSGATKQSPA